MSDIIPSAEQSVADTITDQGTVKEEVREDVFTTEAEATARAKELGCDGIHTHDENGTTIYMPCASHDDYAKITGRQLKEKDVTEALENLEEVLELQSEIKAVKGDEDEEYEKGMFEGYASVFGNTDLGNDVIQMGAFKKSLRKRGAKGVKLLYQHKSDMPIGVFDSVKEDGEGLYVKGRLALGTQAGKEAYELIKMGALDGMSIGFKANPDSVSYDKRSKKRNIGEVDLMEISLVTFPMNPLARVRSVKGQEITIREWENGMRDAFNLSRSEAKLAAKAVHDQFIQRDVEDSSELVDAIKNLTLTLNKF